MADMKIQMEQARKFARRNKTRLTGYIIVVIGALQTAGPALQTLLTSRQMAIFTIVGGLAVAIIGHYNASQQEADQ